MSAAFTSPLAAELAPGLLERFDRYVRVGTTSRRERTGSPSTPGQLELARMLSDELRAIGLEDAGVDENGYVMATLPATVDGGAPCRAHRPRRHEPRRAGRRRRAAGSPAYAGGKIELPRGGAVLDPERMPSCTRSSGTTS
jgi:tripeptide aminopeptidase